jgi:2,3-bisphosphoglycerate-independent phosphoglycerate mutase
MKKIYMIIIDGAADRPIAALGHRTPLEFARTPHLDRLAERGSQCLIDVIGDGICPESDSGAMALLSYDPIQHYTGRGPLEGLGAGFSSLGDPCISFRINFASYNEARDVLDRRTARGLSDEELQQLVDAIRTNVDISDLGNATFELFAHRGYRGVVSFRSELPLSGRVSNTDPEYRNEGPFSVPVTHTGSRPLPCAALSDEEGTRNAANLVNTFIERSAAVLRTHPVNARRVANAELPTNILIFRDGGDPPRALPPFRDRFGRSLEMFGQIAAERGLAQLIGADFSYSRAARGQEESEYLREAERAVVNSKAGVVFIHLKGPDEPGHDGDAEKKVAAIEAIDEHFVRPLLDSVEPSDMVVATCDHATPCSLRIHSADKVPLAISGGGIAADGQHFFGERFAAAGGLRVRRATDLVPYLVAHADGA